jgi:hypothetical protein
MFPSPHTLVVTFGVAMLVAILNLCLDDGWTVSCAMMEDKLFMTDLSLMLLLTGLVLLAAVLETHPDDNYAFCGHVLTGVLVLWGHFLVRPWLGLIPVILWLVCVLIIRNILRILCKRVSI